MSLLLCMLTLATGAGAKERVNDMHLSVITWSLKRGTLDMDRIAGVLAQADLAILQDLDVKETGEGSILVLANLVEQRGGKPICKAWFKNARNQRAPVAILWREDKLNIFDDEGHVQATCAGHPWKLAADDLGLTRAVFLAKAPGRVLSVGALTSSNSRRALPEVTAHWPSLLAGTMRPGKKQTRLLAAVPRQKSPTQWYRNLVLLGAEVMPLNRRFDDVSAAYVRNNIGPSAPVLGRFSFDENDENEFKSQLISRNKGAAPSPAPEPSGEPFPAPVVPQQLSNLNEDIEAEVGDEPESRHPDSVKPQKKKRKRRAR